MITEEPDINLTELAGHFTTCGDYTKEVILEELKYWKSITDFMVLVSRNNDRIDGFLIGYRSRNSLWIAQVWHKSGTSIKEGRKAFDLAKEWARSRGMTSISGETDRTQIKAMKRYGFKEESVNMKASL